MAAASRNDRDAGATWQDVALFVAVAAALRVPMLLSDFWFDEIFSYETFVRPATSILDIFLAAPFRHDNNHQLNTLSAFLIGKDAPWIAYRIPALVCGLITVGAAVRIGQRRSRLEGQLTGLVTAASLMLVVYSTEARGYAWTVCAAAIGFLGLDRFLQTRSRSAMLMFWAAMAGGLAAHAAILHFYLGALLWSGYRLRTDTRTLALLHAVPAAWTAAWITLVVRGSVVGGGPPWTWTQIVDESLAWTLGYPIGVVSVAAAGLAVLALVGWDARRHWLEGSDEGLFSVGAIFGPVALLIALSPPFLFPRYFLVPLFFLLVVFARCLARASRAGRWPRVLSASILLLFTAGNVAHIVQLSRQRYANHSEAVRIMAQRTAVPVLVTSPSLDQWTALPLRFYGQRLGVADRLQYVPRAEQARRAPEMPAIPWLVQPVQPCAPAPPQTRTITPGETYVLRHSFPVCGPSGMSWYLYASER